MLWYAFEVPRRGSSVIVAISESPYYENTPIFDPLKPHF